MRPLTVGLWHHRPVPVRRYGGTERVVVWLADALAELGHRPVLLTPPGSRSETARVVPVERGVMERASRDPDFRLEPHLPAGLDLLHFHCPVAVRPALPHLITIHGNGEPGRFGPRHVFVSRDHMERMGGHHFVHNGVDPVDFEVGPPGERAPWLLFLARTSRRVKGVDRAVRIARRSGVPLVIAGGWRFTWSRRITSVGLVDDRRKRSLLARARALLFPIRWEEPFGLAVVEALASGTPVLASRRGAMPELVDEEVGFLCDSDEAFLEALPRLGEIDPRACRRRVEERFTARRMARDYLSLYGRALEGRLVASKPARGAPRVAIGGSAPRLTVAIMARDAGPRLAELLDAVAWADEVLLLDSGSRDGTPALARARGARVLETDWPGYAAQRRRLLAEVRTPWVLMLDADEVPDPELCAAIRRTLEAGPRHAGYRLRFVTRHGDRWLGLRGWHRERHVRLVRREAARVEGRHLHEGLRVEGTVGDLEGIVYHHGYARGKDRRRKVAEYARLKALRRLEEGRRAPPGTPELHALSAFLRQYLVRGRMLEGRAGLHFALRAAGSEWRAYHALRALRREKSRRASGRNPAEPPAERSP